MFCTFLFFIFPFGSCCLCVLFLGTTCVVFVLSERLYFRAKRCDELGMKISQVQKIPNIAYQIYQRLQIYLVYEKDYIKYKYDRK